MDYATRCTLPGYAPGPGDYAMPERTLVMLLSLLRHLTSKKGKAKTARAAGMSRTTLRKVLQPGANPTLVQLAAIAYAHGVRLNVELEPAPPPVAG